MKDSQLKLQPKLNHRPYFNQHKSPISNYSQSSITLKNHSRVTNQISNSKIALKDRQTQSSEQIKKFILENLTKNRKQQSSQLKDNVIQIEYMSNSRYIGEALQTADSQNIKQGLGIYWYSNQDVYLGSFKNNAFHGPGTYIFSNGQQFQGQFFQGNSVKGKFYYQNGNIYEGQYSNNNPHGYGTMIINPKPQSRTDSSYFKGHWEHGQENGPGHFENIFMTVRGNWKQKIIQQANIEFKQEKDNPQIHYYQGAIQNNKLQGHGKYFFNNYCQYVGQFKEGIFHGKGKISYENGDYYQGTFQYGKRNGQGRYNYKNGDSYFGQFYRDKKHGNGQLKFRNGSSYKGQLINDKIQGSGTYCWHLVTNKSPSGSKVQFIGQFQDGKMRSGQFYQNNQLIRKQLS